MNMAENKVSPIQSEMNLGQDQDSKKVHTEVPWVVEQEPESKPIKKSNETKWILKNIKVNTQLCKEKREEKFICQPEKKQDNHARNNENQQIIRDTEATNAIGKITFDDGPHAAKYVLVDNNTEVSIVLEVMKEKWKLEMPNLLISVVGTMNNFKSHRLAETWRTNLVKAVKGTGAWIITDGKQDYLNKYDEETELRDEQPIISIGITQLETVHNTHQLVNQQGYWPAEYPIQKASIHPNHSHFVLVADGSKDRSPNETTFRAKLENEMTTITSDDGVPFVRLVLEEDQDITEKLPNAPDGKIPVIIVKASDKEADGSEEESGVPNDISNPNHPCICKWNSNSCDFDILQALSTATIDKVTENMPNAMYQLKLIFDWKKFDTALNLSLDTNQQVEILESGMMAAILLDKVECVELMLDNCFDLKKFLTKERIEELQRVFTSGLISTTRGFQALLEKAKEHLDLQDSKEVTVKQLEKYLLRDTDLKLKDSVEKGDNPYLELFLWSVLSNRQDMAKLFWRHEKDAMAVALFAHALLSAMSCQTDDKDFNEECEKHGREFTDLAVGVLKECHKKDVIDAKNMLIRKQSKWEEKSCVLIAVNAKNKQFISDYACQDVFNKIWMGKIDQEAGSLRTILKLFLCILFPWLILFWIKFEKPKSKQAGGNRTTSSSRKTDQNSKHGEKTNTNVCCQKIKETKMYQIIVQKIRPFYEAPVVIFFHNVISYMIFLGLYSYILISKFDRYLSWQEILLCVWVFTIFTQEIKQVVTTPPKNWRRRLCNYVRDGWNILDIATLMLFLLGMILRIIDHPKVSESAHIVLAANLITFYLRLLHIFSVHRQLGPKLVMIMHMVYNLAYFFMILLVFIVAYGIASHAILYPHTEPSLETLTEIFRRPYWNIYGELMLDKIEGSVDCTNDPELYKTGTYSRCPTESGKYFVPVLMGVYMLMCNILLLNLLIAVFSTTYQKVQDNSYLYWSFQQYNLINEYANRPFLAPPLIIFVHLYLLWKWIKKCYETKICEVKTGHNIFLKKVEECEDLRLSTEEDDMSKKYYKNRIAMKMEHNSTVTSEADSTKFVKRIENIEKKLNWMIETNRGAKVVSGCQVPDVEV